MNKKKVSIITLGLTSLAIVAGVGIYGVLNNKENSNAENITANIENKVDAVEDKQIVINKTNEADLLIDYSKMENMLKESDVVAIVKVETAKGQNYNPVRKEYVPIYTTGTLKVNKIVKNINDTKVVEGESIDFVRLGGKIKYSEYLKGLTKAERTKIESVVNSNEKMRNANEKDNIVINDKFLDDIEIEEGKEYVVFLKYVSDYEKYNIIGFEHGLREYNGENNTMKNNTTREYESLDII